MTPDDEAAEIEEANARFYRAFENRDLAEMDQVWAHTDYVRCIHPGWCLLAGWEAIRQSWESIFKDSREMRFSITDVHLNVHGDLGWVTCTENVLAESRGTVSVTSVLATNIFERHGDDWLLIHHHASHILSGEPSPEMGPGGSPLQR